MSYYKEFILLLFLFINVILLILMKVDKNRAKKKQYRISEKTLFIFAIIGGATGGTLGMLLFHHKNKKWYFKVFFPILALMNVYIYYLLLTKYH